MDRRFATLTLDELGDLLSRFPFSRRISAVHLHHTWRPTHAQWAGERTVVAMWRLHTQTNHWRDIAQHLTVAPEGTIWDGRDWNWPPASAAGHNGTEESGPFMLETVGDFDTGRDVLGGAQRAVAVAVIAQLLKRFSLGPEAVRFHREMTHLKTCPGTSVRLDDIRAEVEAARAALPAAPPRARERAGRKSRGATRAVWKWPLEGPEPADAEPDESLMSERQWREMLGLTSAAPRRPRRRKASTTRRGARTRASHARR